MDSDPTFPTGVRLTAQLDRSLGQCQMASKFAPLDDGMLPNVLLLSANKNSFVSIETKQLDFTQTPRGERVEYLYLKARTTQTINIITAVDSDVITLSETTLSFFRALL